METWRKRIDRGHGGYWLKGSVESMRKLPALVLRPGLQTSVRAQATRILYISREFWKPEGQLSSLTSQGNLWHPTATVFLV